jgi:hypothetical protein
VPLDVVMDRSFDAHSKHQDREAKSGSTTARSGGEKKRQNSAVDTVDCGDIVVQE